MSLELLNEWMRINKLSVLRVAAMGGWTHTTVYEWLKKKTVPSQKNRKKIEEISNGFVLADGWKGMPSNPADMVKIPLVQGGEEKIPDYTGQDIDVRVLPKSRVSASVYREPYYNGGSAAQCIE